MSSDTAAVSSVRDQQRTRWFLCGVRSISQPTHTPGYPLSHTHTQYLSCVWLWGAERVCSDMYAGVCPGLYVLYVCVSSELCKPQVVSVIMCLGFDRLWWSEVYDAEQTGEESCQLLSKPGVSISHTHTHTSPPSGWGPLIQATRC